MRLIYQASLALVLGVFAATLALRVTPPPGKSFWTLDGEPVIEPALEPTVETRSLAPQTLAEDPRAPTAPPAPSEVARAVQPPVVLSEQSLGGPSSVAEIRPRPGIEAPAARRPKPAMHRPSGQPGPERLHVVEVAIVPTRVEAARLTVSLRQAGFNPYIVWTGTGFATRLGAFRERDRAYNLGRAATLRGFQTRVFAAN